MARCQSAGRTEHGALIDLTAAFERVIAALDRAGIPCVVVGSTAAAAWGVARTTRDIDLVAIVDPATLDVFLAHLEGADVYVNETDARLAASGGGSFNVIHPSSGGKVDVFTPTPGDDFTQSRLGRRVSAEVLGVSTWVATPEDVVLAKLRWRLQSRSDVQWRDCVEIARIQRLDRRYLDHRPDRGRDG